MFSTKKLHVISEKKIIVKIVDEFLKKMLIVAFFFIIDGKMIVGIAGEST